MLLVKTYLDKSPINGIGLFAGELIPKGTKIWIFTPKLDIAFKTIEVKNQNIFEFLNKYCYKYKGHYVLCVDDGRFINHSNHPNTDDTQGPYTIARQDILPGEEITSNYNDFGVSEDDREFNKI